MTDLLTGWMFNFSALQNSSFLFLEFSAAEHTLGEFCLRPPARLDLPHTPAKEATQQAN